MLESRWLMPESDNKKRENNMTGSWRDRATTGFTCQKQPATGSRGMVVSNHPLASSAGAEMLASEARRRRRMGGALYFYRLKDAPRALLEKGGYMEDIGRENVFPVKTRAIASFYPRLDPEICRHCESRIFHECNVSLPNGEPVKPLETRSSDR